MNDLALLAAATLALVLSIPVLEGLQKGASIALFCGSVTGFAIWGMF